MKKKNMAMIMAGVTVATSVAPAFANNVAEGEDKLYTVNSKDAAKIVEEVRKALEVKFEDGQLKGQKVYDIKMGSTLENLDVITNATELDNVIKALNDAQVVYVQIQDKGHRVEEGKIVDYTFEQYKTATEITTAVAEAEVEGLTATIKSTDTVEVKKGEDVVVVKVGDNKLDFEQSILDTKGKLVGFETLTVDIESGVKHIVAIEKTEATRTEVDAANLYDGIRLTSEGMKLVAKLEEANVTEADFRNAMLDPGFAGAEKASFEIVINKDGKQSEIITVSNEDMHIVRQVMNILMGRIDAKVNVIAGDSRFETAVEVSKAGFADGTADAVVLVGQDAVVDGLAAAPLAAQENAPILLAKNDGVTAEVEAEMLRVLGNNLTGKTIYIVGGVSQISEEAETKLAKLGATVERISGDDRYETSLKIANKITTYSTAFVVGGKGEVDAMSIAAKAADKDDIAPIIVAGKELNEEALEMVEDKTTVIVGGVNSVSEDVKAQLEEVATNNKVVRLAGDDRQGTNAAVINEYYADAEEIFVAKDGYGNGVSHLIDALTAAPLAGKNNAPIVLATNNVSTAQAETAELKLTKVEKITQIGQGIAKTVVEKLGEVLNLF